MKEQPKPSIGLDGIARKGETEKELNQLVAQVFSTDSGKEVLRYLRSITIEMVNGPQVSTEELRHLEGQRFIVGLIEQRVAHGHRSKQ